MGRSHLAAGGHFRNNGGAKPHTQEDSMRTVVTGLIVVFGLSVASTAGAQDKVAQGMKVYEAQKCSICHSIEGKGNKKNPLDSVGAKLSEAEIREWITDPRAAEKKHNSTAKPPMKSFNTLPAADTDALVAYMKSLNKK
jgi:mono/diheme cytochrome c family protein